MPKKFYFSTLVRRPMTLSGKTITFLISSISGGRASGVYATEDEGEILVLDDAVRGRRGVSEITEADFLEAEKKTGKTHSSSNSNASPPRLVRPKITPPLGLDEKTGVVLAGDKPKPSQDTLFQGETHTTPSIASLLRVKRLNPPKPFAESDAKTVRASRRADRAKVRVARGSVEGSK